MYKVPLYLWIISLVLAIVLFGYGKVIYGFYLLAQSLLSLWLYQVNKPAEKRISYQEFNQLKELAKSHH